MRVLLSCLAGLITLAPQFGLAQVKLPPKAAPNATETRYFTSIDGLMDGNADAILKETRQGKTVTAAVLDVCYPAEKGSERKDRFVANLAVNGQSLTGNTQTIFGKQPVTVKLLRKPTGDTFEFRGQIVIGQSLTEVASSDNSDLTEREFLDNQSTDDGIAPSPKDFTEVSPEAVAVKVKLDSAADFLKGLKGQDVEISVSSLVISCDALRAGEQTINISVDPERAAAFIAKAKAMPGVVTVGWTAGTVEMDRAIRIPAAPWRDGEKLNRDKLAAVISDTLSKTLAAKAVSSAWNATTGKFKLTFKRPSDLFPALELSDTVEVAGLVSSDKPGRSEHLMLWIGVPAITTSDESAGSKLILSQEASADEEGDQKNDKGSLEALVKELKGQRWDADNSAWK
jgi:hypothetical protein